MSKIDVRELESALDQKYIDPEFAHAVLMKRAQELFLLVVERLGEYTGEWWTVEVEGGEIAVVRR